MASEKIEKPASLPLSIENGGTGGADLTNAKRNLFICHTIVSGEDLDDYNAPQHAGFYRIRNNVTNSPASWCGMIVIAGFYASDGITQIVFSGTKYFIRSRTGNPLEWTAWVSSE